MIKYFIDGVPHYIADGNQVSPARKMQQEKDFCKGGRILYTKFVKLLQKKNITPYRVAKDTGIAQSTLSDWKTGRANPKADKLLILAEYFGVTVDYFLKP